MTKAFCATVVTIASLTPLAVAAGEPFKLGIFEPGMSYTEFSERIGHSGYVPVEGEGTLANSSSDIAGSNGTAGSFTFVNKGRDHDAAIFEAYGSSGEVVAYRIAAMLPVKGNPEEQYPVLFEKFGSGESCTDGPLGNEFRYDANWDLLEDPHCDVQYSSLGELLPKGTVDHISEHQDWRYTVTAGLFEIDGASQLAITIQDNLEAARLVNPEITWTNKSPAPVETKPDQGSEGVFAMTSIHGVSLGMPQEEAFSTLAQAGFVRDEPQKVYGADEAKSLPSGGRYKVSRDFQSHDNFIMNEEHAFKRANVSVLLKTYPHSAGYLVGEISRTEKLQETVFKEAAYNQIIERTGGLAPNCRENESHQTKSGYNLTEDWKIDMTIPKHTRGFCLNTPYLSSAHQARDEIDRFDKGERAERQMIFSVSRSGYESIPTGHVNWVTVTLVDSAQNIISVYNSSRKSNQARAEKAKAQSGTGVSDF